MNIETRIKLDKFKPRDYQIPICDAILNPEKDYKKVFVVMPRRAGKDVVAFNILIRKAIKTPGIYYMIYPTYSQGRKILWDSVLSNNTGSRFLDFIPKELIEAVNNTEMKIRLTNGSLIQVLGSDNYDSLVGTNPRGIVLSEYALQDPRAYQYLRPALSANDGFALFITTPRGKNHAYELFEIAKNNPEDWFAYHLTLDDTRHIPYEMIEQERQSGELSEDMILQEYWCSWTMGVEGSYYSKYMDKMRLENRIGDVPWEAAFRVNVAFDIGVRDSTCLIFYQCIGSTVKIIDCYEKQKEGLEHYIQVINSKPYTYGKFFAPHDIAVTEWGTGISRLEKARQLGLKFETKMVNHKMVSALPNLSVMDGIEAVRSAFSKIWIDERKCAPLIKALENYRQTYDAKKKVYSSQPLHDQFSHYADAMRYLVLSLPRTRDSLSAEELDRRYQESLYGHNSNMPNIFRDDIPDLR